MTVSTENVILSSLVFNEPYARLVLPHLKIDYFESIESKCLFLVIEKFYQKYNAVPTRETISLDLKALEKVEGVGKISESAHAACQTMLDGLTNETREQTWLVETTEKYCKERALYNALVKASSVMLDNDSKILPESIPELLSEALSVGFDNHVGHDYLEDFEKRYDFYHKKEERIAFNIQKFNDITKGGISRKTLSVILAGTGVGKTLIMCHQAAGNLLDGKNVLYITLEMAEERIAERIDANLLNVPLSDLESLSREEYYDKVKYVKDRVVGKLIIKEYPPAAVHSGHIRALIKELRLKRNFKPDIIYIDYINLCNSARVRQGNGVNSYTLIKAIAEELRGLAVENNLPVVTATQVTRSGMSSSDVDMTDTSESIGLPFTADFMYAAISDEEMEKLNHLVIKQLKNRFDDISKCRRFVVGIDRAKMRLYDLQENAQEILKPKETAVQSAPPKSQKPSFAEELKRRLDRVK